LTSPLQFTEGPFTWDDVYASGELCAFPVRVQGTIVAEQTWFGFPPEGDDAWTSHYALPGNGNVDEPGHRRCRQRCLPLQRRPRVAGIRVAANHPDRQRDERQGRPPEGGRRIVWDGEAFVLDSFRGRFVQFPDFSDWTTARCDTIAN
jgi:hypothetical protein